MWLDEESLMVVHFKKKELEWGPKHKYQKARGWFFENLKKKGKEEIQWNNGMNEKNRGGPLLQIRILNWLMKLKKQDYQIIAYVIYMDGQ